MSTQVQHIIYTIGHSTLAWKDFVYELMQHKIELLVDIRHYPGSRKFPQYNREEMMKALPEAGIEYLHLVDLGGRRKPHPQSQNTIWRHEAFRGYADYMETEAFKDAIAVLISLAKKQRTAIMCSEAVWWRCHRAMVSDYLKAAGFKVWHIMGANKLQEHPYTSAAKIKNNQLSYHS